MPTYEYKCDACGNVFEKFQSIMAAPEKKCPACGKNRARRLIGTGAGLIFKGSGFHITDYRDKSYTDKAKAESGGGGWSGSGESSDSKTEAQSDSKSESKPAETKPESKSESKPKTETKPT